MKDIIGVKFGRLTVVSFTGKRYAKYQPIWLFACDCGNKIEWVLDPVMRGRKRDCGCLRKAQMDLTGKVFGKLTCIKNVGTYRSKTNSTPIWRCSCACGGTSNVVASNLKSGRTKSCGCCEGARDPRVREKMQAGVQKAMLQRRSDFIQRAARYKLNT